MERWERSTRQKGKWEQRHGSRKQHFVCLAHRFRDGDNAGEKDKSHMLWGSIMKVFVFPKTFIVLPFTLRSTNHLEFTFCLVWGRGRVTLLFHVNIQLTHPFLASLLFWICHKSDESIHCGLFLDSFLVQVSLSSWIQHHSFNFHSLTLSAPVLLFFFKIALGAFGSLHFQVNSVIS